MTITEDINIDILLDKNGQPIIDKDKKLELVEGDECWLQDIRLEAATQEGELHYEDEEGDESYGFGLMDFVHTEYDEFTVLEIQQRIHDKLVKRDYIDEKTIKTEITYEEDAYNIQVVFCKNDNNKEYNLDIEISDVEVKVE